MIEALLRDHCGEAFVAMWHLRCNDLSKDILLPLGKKQVDFNIVYIIYVYICMI